MEKAYIVLAHKNADQVARLLAKLDDNRSTFFLHIDNKANLSEFKNLVTKHKNLIEVKSVDTQWGSFGLVEATLNAISLVLGYHKHFDFITLLSGQHYPIKSNKDIDDYLCQTNYCAFLEYSAIPNYERWKPRGGMYRIDRYFFGLQLYERYTAKALNFLLQKIDFFKRQFPENMQPYGGSQWWTLDNYSLQYIMHFVKGNEAYVKFQKQSFAPDELFFHNILLNAHDEKIKSNIVNDNLLYVNWPDSKKGHPEVLKATDFHSIVKSNALFARKFDAEQDSGILDLLDDYSR